MDLMKKSRSRQNSIANVQENASDTKPRKSSTERSSRRSTGSKIVKKRLSKSAKVVPLNVIRRISKVYIFFDIAGE